MVNNHYRWDFIGLSTDEKPTPETSEKVVNGSTFYCSDTSKLYVFCDGTWYERKPLGGGGGGGGSYTAGYGIDIVNDEISVDDQVIATKQDLSGKQDTLTAGSNITISDDTISATDTTYSAFTGTDGTTAGAAGLVPAPATTDANKFLKSDGTWDTAGGGSSVNVVQTTGTSTTDVMSQNAASSMIYANPASNNKINIGQNNISGSNASIVIGNNSNFPTSGYGVIIGASCNNNGTPIINISGSTIRGSQVIGLGASTYEKRGDKSVYIGYDSDSRAAGSLDDLSYTVGLGAGSAPTRKGELNIETVNSSPTGGFNDTQYRVIGGVHDGQLTHDAVTVGQVNAVIDAINTALSTNIPHIGA